MNGAAVGETVVGETAVEGTAVGETAAEPGVVGTAEVVLQNPLGHPATDAPELAAWLERLVAALAPDAASFTARFVDDDAMRAFNRDYRGKDRPTDVLSFPGGETPEGRHLGDVVISVPTAERQAAAGLGAGPGTGLGAGLGDELRRLLLHGVLHCLGHDHETDDGEMDELEARLRREWL